MYQLGSKRPFSLLAALGCLSVRFGTDVSTHSDTRACGCQVDHHQQLWQEALKFAADLRPDIPDIIVNFHHDFHFEVTQLHISEISPEMHAAAVSSWIHLQSCLSRQSVVLDTPKSSCRATRFAVGDCSLVLLALCMWGCSPPYLPNLSDPYLPNLYACFEPFYCTSRSHCQDSTPPRCHPCRLHI